MRRVMDMLKGLAGERRQVVAVDFDSRRLRLACAERVGGEVRVARLTGLPIPEDADPADPQKLGTFLGRALARNGLAGAGVIMSVPRSQAVLKPLTLPAGTSPGEMAGMVRYQMEKELPFPVEEAVIDFTVERHYGAATAGQGATEGVDILVAAVRLPVVDYYRQAAASAGAKLLRLGLRPYANLRCLDACGTWRGRGRVALLFVTADETEIDVLTGTESPGLAFSRSALAKIPPAGSAEGPPDESAVQALAADVGRSLQSYQSLDRSERIGLVLVAGGTGAEGSLAEKLSGQLGVPCELWDPCRALRLEGGPEVSAFAPSIGLAISSYGAVLPFDFLNPKRPVVRRDRKRIVSMVAAGCVGAVVLGIVAAGWGHLSEKQQRLRELSTQLKGLNEENTKKVSPLEARHKAVEAWLTNDRKWLAQWARLSSLFPPCTEVYIKGLRSATDAGTVTFTLQARESEVITQLNSRLREAGYDVRPGPETTADDPWGYNYTTTARVSLPRGMQIDPDSLGSAARPEDDVSAEQLSRGAPPEAEPSSPGRTRGPRR